jgi:hypothetical protein
MVKRYILPAAWVMTARTILPELPLMVVFGGMTGVTVFWRAFKDPIHMT